MEMTNRLLKGFQNMRHSQEETMGHWNLDTINKEVDCVIQVEEVILEDDILDQKNSSVKDIEKEVDRCIIVEEVILEDGILEQENSSAKDIEKEVDRCIIVEEVILEDGILEQENSSAKDIEKEVDRCLDLSSPSSSSKCRKINDECLNKSPSQPFELISTNNELPSISGTSRGIQVSLDQEDVASNEKKVRRKIKTLQGKLRRRVKKISGLKSLISELKRNNHLDKEKSDRLLHGFEGTTLDIFENEKKNISRHSKGRRYTNELKSFALTLNYYSPKAYNFCR